jgi:hypothetical protein
VRALSIVVVVESIALIALGLLWLLAQGARPPGGAVGSATGALADAPAARRATPGEREVGTATEPDRRKTVTSRDPEVGVIVHGRITTTDGSALPENLSVSFRRGRTYRSATTLGDRYAAAALESGTWSIRAAADAFVVQEFEHELGPETLQVLDLQLEPAHSVAIFVTGPEGEPLLGSQAVSDLGLHWGRLHVIATETALAGDLPPTDGASVGDLGIGRFQLALAVGPIPYGELWLDRPPPANAALLLRHVVLAQQPIARGQRELRFVLGADALRSKFGAVALRLSEGATGRPLEGISVRLSAAPFSGSSGRTDADGRATVEHVLPGLVALEISPPAGLETVSDLVWVPVGQAVDLGEIALQPSVEAPGRVLDADGAPAHALVRWTDLGTMDFPRELVERRSMGTDAEGRFRLQVGPRRFVLVAQADDARIGHTVLDARAGIPAPAEIRIGPAAYTTVTARGPKLESFVATLRDADGVPIAARRFGLRFRSQTLAASPGQYTLEVHGEGDRLVLRRDLALRAGQTAAVEVR